MLNAVCRFLMVVSTLIIASMAFYRGLMGIQPSPLILNMGLAAAWIAVGRTFLKDE